MRNWPSLLLTCWTITALSGLCAQEWRQDLFGEEKSVELTGPSRLWAKTPLAKVEYKKNQIGQSQLFARFTNLPSSYLIASIYYLSFPLVDPKKDSPQAVKAAFMKINKLTEVIERRFGDDVWIFESPYRKGPRTMRLYYYKGKNRYSVSTAALRSAYLESTYAESEWIQRMIVQRERQSEKLKNQKTTWSWPSEFSLIPSAYSQINSGTAGIPLGSSPSGNSSSGSSGSSFPPGGYGVGYLPGASGGGSRGSGYFPYPASNPCPVPASTGSPMTTGCPSPSSCAYLSKGQSGYCLSNIAACQQSSMTNAFNTASATAGGLRSDISCQSSAWSSKLEQTKLWADEKIRWANDKIEDILDVGNKITDPTYMAGVAALGAAAGTLASSAVSLMVTGISDGLGTLWGEISGKSEEETLKRRADIFEKAKKEWDELNKDLLKVEESIDTSIELFELIKASGQSLEEFLMVSNRELRQKQRKLDEDQQKYKTHSQCALLQESADNFNQFKLDKTESIEKAIDEFRLLGPSFKTNSDIQNLHLHWKKAISFIGSGDDGNAKKEIEASLKSAQILSVLMQEKAKKCHDQASLKCKMNSKGNSLIDRLSEDLEKLYIAVDDIKDTLKDIRQECRRVSLDGDYRACAEYYFNQQKDLEGEIKKLQAVIDSLGGLQKRHGTFANACKNLADEMGKLLSMESAIDKARSNMALYYAAHLWKEQKDLEERNKERTELLPKKVYETQIEAAKLAYYNALAVPVIDHQSGRPVSCHQAIYDLSHSCQADQTHWYQSIPLIGATLGGSKAIKQCAVGYTHARAIGANTGNKAKYNSSPEVYSTLLAYGQKLLAQGDLADKLDGDIYKILCVKDAIKSYESYQKKITLAKNNYRVAMTTWNYRRSNALADLEYHRQLTGLIDQINIESACSTISDSGCLDSDEHCLELQSKECTKNIFKTACAQENPDQKLELSQACLNPKDSTTYCKNQRNYIKNKQDFIDKCQDQKLPMNCPKKLASSCEFNCQDLEQHCYNGDKKMSKKQREKVCKQANTCHEKRNICLNQKASCIKSSYTEAKFRFERFGVMRKYLNQHLCEMPKIKR